MGLFGRREDAPSPSLGAQVLDLGARIGAVESELRSLRGEVSLTSDLVAKRMRRAVAAERVVERTVARNQEESANGVAPPPPARRSAAWGARARIRARRALSADGAPDLATAED